MNALLYVCLPFPVQRPGPERRQLARRGTSPQRWGGGVIRYQVAEIGRDGTLEPLLGSLIMDWHLRQSTPDDDQ